MFAFFPKCAKSTLSVSSGCLQNASGASSLLLKTVKTTKMYFCEASEVRLSKPFTLMKQQSIISASPILTHSVIGLDKTHESWLDLKLHSKLEVSKDGGSCSRQPCQLKGGWQSGGVPVHQCLKSFCQWIFFLKFK